jgi:hypothetical protein
MTFKNETEKFSLTYYPLPINEFALLP